MSGYLRDYSTRRTPQSEAIPGSTQVANSAGGFAWAVDDWTRLHRFLILGAEGGTYYADERKLTGENARTVLRCIKADGLRAVAEIVAVSTAGRAPKNDPAIFALALAASLGDEKTRRAALDALPRVCRIGTHLFHFAAFIEQHRGWGRGLRRAVGEWYTAQEPDALAYQLVKYRQRDGWSHRDLLRLAHPPHSPLLAWAAGKEVAWGDVPLAIAAFEQAQAAATPAVTADLIAHYGDKLPREALQTDHLTSTVVWDALLHAGMPQTALIHNLATMTRIGLLTPTSDAAKLVGAQLVDEDRLRKARVHPIAALSALLTYASGQSARGSSTWTPLPRIVDALNIAFYRTFGNVEPTGKRWLLALDVSGSMDVGVVAGVPGLTPRVASSAMAMVTAATGDPYEVVAFTSAGGGYRSAALSVLPLSDRQRLDDICNGTRGIPFGGTDCAMPMLYATQAKREFDMFAVYTDSETWAGNVHPAQALKAYREQSGLNAKLAVVGMVSNGFSIADPNDAGMLDFVGFDTATPAVMQDFAGEFTGERERRELHDGSRTYIPPEEPTA